MKDVRMIKNEIEIKPTHELVFEDKHFPFNFYMFENSSLYFQRHKSILFPKKEISILKEPYINLSEDDINTFLLFVNNKDIEIPLTQQNVLPLFYLGKQYEIPTLITHTNKYIQDFNLSLKYLIFFQNKSDFPLEEFIDQVSNDFLVYVHDRSHDLLKLNFNLLYQIIEKAKIKSFSQSEYIDFLFNCLDTYGRKASVLFQNIDFGSLQKKYFQRLLSYQTSDFDPNFINNEMLKSIYEKEIEIVNKENEIKMKEQQLDDRISQVEKLVNLYQQKIDEIEETNKQRDQEYKQKIDDLNNKLRFAKLYNERKFEYDEKKKNSFDGIIQYLTNQCGDNVHKKGIVEVKMPSMYSNRSAERAVDLNNASTFAQTNGQENSWLKYDFKNKKVHPTYYSIRTREDYYEKCYNPKTWVIEGSNTDIENDWTLLDSRDIDCFKEKSAVCTFKITTQLACDTSFRYLRMKLTGPDTGGAHYLSISALEYFGCLLE